MARKPSPLGYSQPTFSAAGDTSSSTKFRSPLDMASLSEKMERTCPMQPSDSAQTLDKNQYMTMCIKEYRKMLIVAQDVQRTGKKFALR